MNEQSVNRAARAGAFILGVLVLASLLLMAGSLLLSGRGRLDITLYFSNLSRTGLVAVERNIPEPDGKTALAEQIVKELVYGPVDNAVLPTLPPRLKITGVWLSGTTAYVDFGRRFLLDIAGDTAAKAEELSVYSVVNTLTANISGIEKVQILVEGVPVRTVRGLTRTEKPLFPREGLIERKK